MYYSFKQRKGEEKTALFFSKPRRSLALKIYNAGESNFLKSIQKKFLQKIALEKKIYVPM